MKHIFNYDFSCYFSLVASSSWTFPEFNVSVKSKLQHHPGQPPGLYNFWKTSVEIPPSSGQKDVQIRHYMFIFGDAGDSNSVPDPDLEIRGGRVI